MIKLSEIANKLGFGIKHPVSDLAKVDAELAIAREKVSALEEKRGSIIEGLREDIHFMQILPNKENSGLHSQLLRNERVHPLDTVEELVDQRIGAEGANKRCFARVVSNNGQPVVTAGIFTALVHVPLHEGELEYSDIPGNIDQIKSMEVEPFLPPVDGGAVAVLYTISSSSEHDWERGGRPLAEAVYAYLNTEAEERGYPLVISTLSPVRNFSVWLKGQSGFEAYFDDQGNITEEFQGFLEADDNQALVKEKLMEYLVKEKDPVLNFHLGNGAYIGDLKVNPDNKTDWAMVNYVYASNSNDLARNKGLYKQAQMKPVAPHLQHLLGDKFDLLSKVSGVYASQNPGIGMMSQLQPEA